LQEVRIIVAYFGKPDMNWSLPAFKQGLPSA